jgi:hypothetical protein
MGLLDAMQSPTKMVDRPSETVPQMNLICASRAETACRCRAKYFSNELEKLQREDAIAESVRGPTNWGSWIRKHREVLNISLDPPETKRILLKTKKFVNACLCC